MSRLTRDGAAEPVSRDQILSGVNGDRKNIIFPDVQLAVSSLQGPISMREENNRRRVKFGALYLASSRLNASE